MILNKARINSKQVVLLVITILILVLVFTNLNYIITKFNDFYNYLNNENNSSNNNTNNNLSMEENMKIIEGFHDPSVDMPSISQDDLSIEILKDSSSIKVNYPKIDLSDHTDFKTKGYILALAKYDYNLHKKDETAVEISDEYNDYSQEIMALVKRFGYNKALATNYLNLKSFTMINIKTLDNNNPNVVKPKINLMTSKELDFNKKYIYYISKYGLESGNANIKNIFKIYNKYYLNNRNDSNLNLLNDLDNITGNDEQKMEISITNANKIKEFLEELETNYPESTIVTNSEKMGFIKEHLMEYCNMIINGELNNKSICDSDGNCSYTFKNLDMLDENNNLYYYKIGVAAVLTKLTTTGTGTSSTTSYDTHVTAFTPFVLEGKQYITIDKTIEQQRELIRKLSDLERSKSVIFNKAKSQQQTLSIDEDEYVNEYMEMLKPHIGDYPNEFTLTKDQINQYSLNEYLNKSFSKGVLNVNLLTGN